MAVIKVNSDGVNGLRSNVRNIKSKNDECHSNLNRVKWNLDWQIKAKSNISGKLSEIQRRLNRQEDKLEAYIRVLETAVGNYCDKDKQLSREAKNIIYTLNSMKYSAISRASSAWSSNAVRSRESIQDINSLFLIDRTQPVNLGMLK